MNNKAQKLEEQKQAEKRKTLFGVRKPICHSDIINLQQSLQDNKNPEEVEKDGLSGPDGIIQLGPGAHTNNAGQ